MGKTRLNWYVQEAIKVIRQIQVKSLVPMPHAPVSTHA